MELVITGEFAEKILTLLKKDKGLANSLAAEWLDRVELPKMATYLFTQKVAAELLAARLVSDPQGTMKDLQALAAGDAVGADAVGASAVKAPARRGRPPKAAAKVKKTRAKKAGRKKAAKTVAAVVAPAPKKAAKKKAAKKVAKKKATKKVAKKAAPKKAAKKVAKKAAAPKAGIRRRKRLSKAQIASVKGKVVDYLGSTAAASRKQIIEAAAIPTPALYNRIIGELRDAHIVASEGEKAKAVYFLAKKTAGRKKARKTKR